MKQNGYHTEADRQEYELDLTGSHLHDLALVTLPTTLRVRVADSLKVVCLATHRYRAQEINCM